MGDSAHSAARTGAGAGGWLRQHRVWVQLAALALACLLALGWGWLVTTRAADGRDRYQIINDEYSVTLAPADPARGLEQAILAGPDTPLYGVRLLFTTYDRVVHGTLFVDLLDEAGTPLAHASCAMTELLDNTFMALIFDAPVLPQAENTPYTLRITTAPDTAEDRVGLWCSETAMPGFGLTDPAAPQAGGAGQTAALQYVVDHTGNWADRLFWAPAALLALAVLGGWWLAAVKQVSAWRLFCTAAGVLGLCFALVTPPLAAPDEYSHAAASYAMASRMLGQPDFDEEGRLLMRPCDAPYMTDETGEVGMFAYKRLAQGLGEVGCAGQVSEPVKVSAPYEPFGMLYLAPALGVLAARLLGLGFYGMLLAGRLANLALYIGLAGAAVRRMPFAGNMLFCVGLLPMCLQLAASFSPDALVLGLSFALFALALECADQNCPVSGRQAAGLVILSALLAPCKAIYLGLAALCFAIPAERFARPGARLSGVRRARLLRLGCCGAALASWCAVHLEYLGYTFRDLDLGLLPALAVAAVAAAGLWYALRGPESGPTPAQKKLLLALCGAAAVGGAAFVLLFSHMGGQLTPEELAAAMQPNGDSAYTWSMGYLLRHLPGAAKLLMATITDTAPQLLQGLLGTALGEPIVFTAEASWIYTLALAGLLAVSALRKAGQPARLKAAQRRLVGALALLAAGLSVLACLMWTPVNYDHIFGWQGRYLLPVLPLALLLWGENRTLVLAREAEPDTAVRVGGIALTALVLLQAVGLYAAL